MTAVASAASAASSIALNVFGVRGTVTVMCSRALVCSGKSRGAVCAGAALDAQLARDKPREQVMFPQQGGVQCEEMRLLPRAFVACHQTGRGVLVRGAPATKSSSTPRMCGLSFCSA